MTPPTNSPTHTTPTPTIPYPAACVAAPRIAVFGIGNLLRSDDAFGPRVIERIDALGIMPSSVRVADLGTPGLDLASHVAGFDLVVLIDTVMIDAPPGTLVRLSKDDLVAPREATPQSNPPRPPRPPRPRMTMHDAGIEDAIALAELAGNPVGEVELIGVVPVCLDQGVSLSPHVEAAIDRAVNEAVRIVSERVGA